MYVVTADQKSSRTRADRVPAALAALEATLAATRTHRSKTANATSRPFERTAGDEVQALFTDPVAVVAAVVQLLRLGDWWVGVGIGPVTRPLPRTARAGRGPAYLAARQAVEAAKSSPAGLCIAGGDGSPASSPAGRAEAAAWLLSSLLTRRTVEGWEVIDLMDHGARQVDAATKLGISPQAVSRRLRVAGWQEEQRGRELLVWLLAQADHDDHDDTATDALTDQEEPS